MNQSLDIYKTRLEKDFPDLNADKIRLIGSGWHHDAIEVNGSLVFRMPRGVHADSGDLEIDFETQLLEKLGQRLSVDIPLTKHVDPSGHYFGYTKVKGVQLTSIVDSMTEAQTEELISDWIVIASNIHSSISVDEARSIGAPDFEGFDPELSIEGANRIFNATGVDSRVLDFAKEIISQTRELSTSKRSELFIHNDLQFHNLIADPETKRITGVIDWTDACIGTIEREFAIWEWIKYDLLRTVTQLYEDQVGASVDVSKVLCWRSAEDISDYAEHLAVNDRQEADAAKQRIYKLMEVYSSVDS
ncbi:MAG: aminoglycoside phosphotransferase family protein [Patescibacteria group bacterium]